MTMTRDFLMNRLRPIALGMLLGAIGMPLVAQSSRRATPTALGKLWHTMPPKNGAPGFKYQIAAEDAKVRFLVLMDPALDLSQWSLHAWFGDPRVTALLQIRRSALHQAVETQRPLAQDERHQTSDCQTQLRAFTDAAQVAEGRLTSYDAFHQVIYRFSGEASTAGSWALGQEQLIEKQLDKGRTCFEGSYDIDRHFDLADLHLGALSYHLALTPVTEAHTIPLGEASPHVLALAKPLNLEGDTTQPLPLLRALGADVPELFLATPEGYVSSRAQLLRRLPCAEAETPVVLPGAWEPLSIREITIPGESAVPLTLWSCGSRVAFAWKGEEIYESLAWERPLSGQAELGWSILDLQTSGEGTSLLLKVESRSRPMTLVNPCERGSETELIWITWDLQRKVKSLQQVLVDSCNESLLGQPSDSDAEWRFLDTKRDMLVHIQFDRTHPDLGLQRSEEAKKTE